MITVCQKHIKNGINLLNAPHVQKLSQKYWEHECIFCSEPAHFKLFYSTPYSASYRKFLSFIAYWLSIFLRRSSRLTAFLSLAARPGACSVYGSNCAG